VNKLEIKLTKKPQNCTIIEGFPGFGLIATIATEFLVEHLKAELIGEFFFEEMPPTLAIHKGKMVRPIAIYYDKKHNIVILHSIVNTKGFEWKIADSILELANRLKAKEIISLEGVGTTMEEETKLYYYGHEKLDQYGAEPIEESIIMGVSSALLLRSERVSCVFASTHSALPDSKAAAKIIEFLDKYLGLNVDYAPLVEQARMFEKKLKNILRQSVKAGEEADKKQMSYLG
jgi:uncharacterized protein